MLLDSTYHSITIMRSFTCTRSALRVLRTHVPSPTRPTFAPQTSSLPRQLSTIRAFHAARPLHKQQAPPPDTRPPTDFNDLNVLGNTPAPSTSVDVCMHDGFGLNSGITISDGNGALLVNGEAFAWRPWTVDGKMQVANAKGQFEVPAEAFGVFDVLWPRPGTS